MEEEEGARTTRGKCHVGRSLAWASATLILLPIFAELQFSKSLQAVCKCFRPLSLSAVVVVIVVIVTVVVTVVVVVVGGFLLMMPEALVKLSRLKLLAASNCRHQRSFAPPPVNLSPPRQQVGSSPPFPSVTITNLS